VVVEDRERDAPEDAVDVEHIIALGQRGLSDTAIRARLAAASVTV
jgi:hypothetical protein